MEMPSPALLPLLFFRQGRDDDAYESKPDAKGLGQREAFSEDGNGEDKGEYGDEVAEEGYDARFKVFECEVEAQIDKETHADPHIEQAADCGRGDVGGHGRHEHEGQEYDGSAERLNG